MWIEASNIKHLRRFPPLQAIYPYSFKFGIEFKANERYQIYSSRLGTEITQKPV